MNIEKKTIENDLEFLRQVSALVDFSNDDWKEALASLDYYCKNTDNLLALASVQIGIPLRMIYLIKTDLERFDEDYNDEIVLINPKVIKSEGLTRYWESCDSCLNYAGLVNRPYRIELEYYNVSGKKCYQTFTGFEATVLSHELDHLDGILHIDRAIEIVDMPKEERVELRKREPYQIIRKDGEFADDEWTVDKQFRLNNQRLIGTNLDGVKRYLRKIQDKKDFSEKISDD